MPRTTLMTPSLLALIAEQDGVVTTGQLHAHGFSADAVQRRVSRGHWQRLLTSVILTHSGQPTRRQLLVAAWLWAGAVSAVDGVDAMVWYGVRPAWWRADQVHVVVEQESALRSREFVVVRRSCAEITIGDRGLVPYVPFADAAIVAARSAPDERAAIQILSQVLQQGRVTTRQLNDARERIGDKWCRSVDAALVAVGVGLRSPAEKDNRELILTSRILPEPSWNQWLDLGDREGLVCVDALWEDAGMVDEVNGRRYHAWAKRFEDTEARRARLEAVGLAVTGCTPIQLRRDPLRVLDRKERTYLRHAGRGMPSAVRLVDPPAIAA